MDNDPFPDACGLVRNTAVTGESRSREFAGRTISAEYAVKARTNGTMEQRDKVIEGRGTAKQARFAVQCIRCLPGNACPQLNHTRLIRLLAEILQTGGGIGIDVYRMIEGVEEVRRKTAVGRFP
jgi:hypothetical protein